LLINHSKTKTVRTKENNTTERASQEARVLANSLQFQGVNQNCNRIRQQAKALPSARRRHFAAGQKYGVWWYANRRFCFNKKATISSTQDMIARKFDNLHYPQLCQHPENPVCAGFIF
jgi:hypothetical protein